MNGDVLRRWLLRAFLWIGLLVTGLYLFARPLPSRAPERPPVVAGGLVRPRGLAVVAGGSLWITEGSGRLSRLDPDGEQRTVLGTLPAAPEGASVIESLGGPVAVTLLPDDPEPYLLIGQAADERAASIWRVTTQGTAERLLGLTSQPASGQARLVPAAMAAGPERRLLVTDARGALLLLVQLASTPGGGAADVTARVLAALPRESTPIAATYAAAGPYVGTWLVALMGPPPHFPGTGSVVSVADDGRTMVVAQGLTTPAGVAIGADGQILVLETSAGYDPQHQRIAPRSGRVLLLRDSERRVLAGRLDYPLGMVTAPSGDLYIATGSLFGRPGEGAILRVPADVIEGGGRPLVE